MTHSRTALQLYLAAAVCFASCASTPRVGAANANERAAGLEIGGRSAAVISDHGFGALLGVQLGWRISPEFSLGGYVDGTPLFSPFKPKCDCVVERRRPLRTGLFGDFALVRSASAVPWVRVAVGVVRTDVTTVDIELNSGLDFRVATSRFGPYLSVSKAVGHDQPKLWLGAGLRFFVPL